VPSAFPKYVERLPRSVSATCAWNSSERSFLVGVDERDLHEHRRGVHADEHLERRLLDAPRRDAEQPVEVALDDLREPRRGGEVLVLREVPQDEVHLAESGLPSRRAWGHLVRFSPRRAPGRTEASSER
jgi:hypothetical protein